jgi:hypothetical protein
VGSYGRTRALLLHPYHRQVNQNAAAASLTVLASCDS